MPHQVLALMNHGMCSITIKRCLIAMLPLHNYRIGLSSWFNDWIHKTATNFSNNAGASIVLLLIIFAKFQLGNWHQIHHIFKVPIEKPKLNFLYNYTYQYSNLMYKNNLYENTLGINIKYTFLNMSKTLYDISQNMKTNFGICLNS